MALTATGTEDDVPVFRFGQGVSVNFLGAEDEDSPCVLWFDGNDVLVDFKFDTDAKMALERAILAMCARFGVAVIKPLYLLTVIEG